MWASLQGVGLSEQQLRDQLETALRRANYWRGKHAHLRRRVRELLFALPVDLPVPAVNLRLILAALTSALTETMDRAAEPAAPVAALAALHKLVSEQANDEGLWFDARYITESYLQQELRRLHAAIEALVPAPEHDSGGPQAVVL